jgi:hypothetical protein
MSDCVSIDLVASAKIVPFHYLTAHPLAGIEILLVTTGFELADAARCRAHDNTESLAGV